MEQIYKAGRQEIIIIIIIIIIKYTKKRPSWEANRFSASQEIPCILWIPVVHNCIQKIPPNVPILSQINPVMSLFHFLRSSLILSSHLRLDLPSGFFPSGFHTKIMCAPLVSPIYAKCPPISFLIWSSE